MPSLVAAAALVAMTLVTYLPALRNGFIWDDDFYVVENRTLRSLEGLRQMWFEPHSLPQYYPLVHTTFWVEYHLWGDRPRGYHLDNILLHGLSAVLFWQVLTRLSVPGAWFAAAIFALHPVEVESVAWITERKNVLSCVLALSSLLAWYRFAPPEGDYRSARPHSRWGWYALSLALFVGALASKTVVASLPAVILVAEWWKRGRLRWADVLALVPFFAVGGAMGVATAWLEKDFVGAHGADWELSAVDRVLVAGRALCFYVGKLIWPYPLVFHYRRWDIDAGVWWQYLFPAAALATFVALWLARKRIGRGPLAAALIFAGVLAPALGFLNVYPFRFSFVADHFQYHANLALIALAGAGAALVFRRVGISPASTPKEPEYQAAAKPRGGNPWASQSGLVDPLSTTPWPSAVLATVVLAALGFLSFRQAQVYHDRETLFRHVIAKSPTSWVAYTNLSVYLESLGRRDETIQLARQALALRPDDAVLHYNLGAVLMRLGNRDGFRDGEFDEAVAEFKEALRLDPDYANAHGSLGTALVRKNRSDEALAHSRRAVELLPGDPYALYHLGSVLGAVGRLPEAESYLRRTIELNREHGEFHYGLALVLIRQGRVDEASEHFREALRIDPTLTDAYLGLANALVGQERLEEAVDYYRQVIDRRPSDFQALNNLAVTLLKMGRTDRAIPYLEQALRVKPDYEEARANLERARDSLELPTAP
ncbi:MAG: tetratricopeptide repeat protein [Planctomycetia bacterium]|nr:tetratricopeptide repeat protein [Planctomycetia bacterium]